MRRFLGIVICAGWATVLLPGVAATERNGHLDAVAVTVQRVTMLETPLRDEVAMVLMGTALLAVASLVRRSACCNLPVGVRERGMRPGRVQSLREVAGQEP